MSEVLNLDNLEKHIRDNYLEKDFGENQLDEPFELNWRLIRDFAWGLSDPNPLYCDAAYAAKARWNCQIAPPTIASSIRYPQTHAGIWDKPYQMTNLVAGNRFEWFDVFRVGDRITTSLVIKNLYRKKGKTGDLLLVVTEGGLWNHHGNLIAKQYATQVQVEMPPGVKLGEKLLYQQEPYKYSKEEIAKIVECYDNETVRGAKPLYWEDVAVGDKLKQIGRGPLTLGDMMQFNGKSYFGGPVPGTFKVSLNAARSMPAASIRTNPTTNWPYEDMMWEHYDFNLVRARGLPLPFDLGCMRYMMAATLITNWMGDDGYLRRLDARIQRPNYYGDTTWFSGEVVNKYKETQGGVEYGAVDIKIQGVNQVGDSTTPGTATVYLPSPGRPVQIPVPV